MTHRVIFEGGPQTLRHVVPEFVASATYEVIDATKAQDDVDRVLDSGPATVPGFTLTLDGEAGPGESDPRRIRVGATAPSLVIGDELVVIAADSSFEAFELAAVATDDYLTSSSFLAGTYPVGSTVRGVTITVMTTAALHDSEDALDDQRPLMVIWSYTTGSGPRLVSEPVALSRGNAAAFTVGPAIQSLLRGYPELAGRLLEGLTVLALAEYSRETLIAELSARYIDHETVMMGDAGRMLLAAKMLDEAALRGYSPGTRDLERFAEFAHTDYTRQLANITTGRAGSQVTTLDTEQVATVRGGRSNQNPITIGL